jgi:hypothetical protein
MTAAFYEILIISSSYFMKKPIVFYVIAQLCLIFFATLACGDIYVVSSSTALALIPFSLFFFYRKKYDWKFQLFLFALGLFTGISNYVRTHSGTLVLVFVGIMIVVYCSTTWARRLFFVCLILSGYLIPVAYVTPILKERDEFFRAYSPEGSKLSIGAHVLWFNVYIGLGFLDNPYGLAYKDEIATKKYQSLLPGTHGSNTETEKVLKKAVFDFVKEHPGFVVKTVFIKILFILGYLLLYVNLGLLIRWKIHAPLFGEWAFWGALAFGSLSGILIIPHPSYLLGFGAVATLYGVWIAMEQRKHLGYS